MRISSLSLKGFRNFKDACIEFRENTLVIGANDIGKTNMLRALRILLDKTLSESDIEPSELDFYIGKDDSSEHLEITLFFDDIKEDAVLSILKGSVSDNGQTVIKYAAQKSDLSYKIYTGSSDESLKEVSGRFYLKHMNLKYIQSQRDMERFIQREKKQLLRTAQAYLTQKQSDQDDALLSEIRSDLSALNNKVSGLMYVKSATNDVNEELKKLAHHHSDYEVQLDTGAIQVNDFIDKLQLGAVSNGNNVMLGGDGRNNQILLALWKAKSVIEHDAEHEVVFYVIEEPEAHLHPHQQRKLANYLIGELPGQTIISSHSPQIAVNFKPDSIVRLLIKNSATHAASNGCSDCIMEGWEDMSYRMSILPAEAFFSGGVFLVEGPSEVLFYNELAKQLGFDFDFENLSILSVEGVAFKIYAGILDALEIPWVMRTDNDISKVPGQNRWNYAGINRCLALADIEQYEYIDRKVTPQETIENGVWREVSSSINRHGIFLAKIDLESDLVNEMSASVCDVLQVPNGARAIEYLQSKKAYRMRELIKRLKRRLSQLGEGELAKPLYKLVEVSREPL